MFRLRLLKTVGPSTGSVMLLVGSRAEQLGSVGQDYLQKLWEQTREVRCWLLSSPIRRTAGVTAVAILIVVVTSSSAHRMLPFLFGHQLLFSQLLNFTLHVLKLNSPRDLSSPR